MHISKGNAVAGVGSRNGVKISDFGATKTEARDTAVQPILARALTAVLDREGHVLAVLADRGEARAFLRGGCA